MNTLKAPARPEVDPLARRLALTGILEHTIASLELTDEQRKSVESTYREVGSHLAKALKLEGPDADIFPQGSYRLGTVIRPWRDITDVFDLDIVFRLVMSAAGQDAKKYREAVGRHLREKYAGLVQPLPKGWRLDYSAERDYYLDIIPAMDAGPVNVIAITDGSAWRDSNPRGFGNWFEETAKMLPQIGLMAFSNSAPLENRQARIEKLPEYTAFKLPLQRITQISKRHRDYYFNKKIVAPKKAPSSIVITTLLAKSYARCVGAHPFESGYDLLVECVEGMRDFIQVAVGTNQKTTFTLKNPSLVSENLVAKWNDDPALATAFYEWHGQFLTFLVQLPEDRAPQRKLLEETLGKGPVNAAYQKELEMMSAARQSSSLRVVPRVGLSSTATAGVLVPNLTIHGTQ